MSTTVNASKRHLEINATEFDGQLDGTIKTNTTATTQSAGDNSTKVATTAYADAVLPSWVPTSNPSYLTGINSSQVTNALGFTPYNATNPSNYITGYTVTQGDVTGHQAALSITESQISDLQSYLTAIPSGYATESYVQTQITNLVDSAPSTLNTLDELALALGDDPNFATTIATNIGTKLPKSGGTMSGNLLMGNSAITGVNYLEFNDPGPSEGLQWNGGNIKIYESPDNLTTNSAGNLQIVYGTTRRLTVNNSGIDVNGSVTATSLDINGDADINGVFGFNTTTDLLTITNNQNTGGINFVGGNSRIYFSGYRAIEGATNGGVLSIGESFGQINLLDNVEVTGELQADSLDIDGNADISGTLDVGAVNADGNITVTKGSATVKVEESGGADVRMAAGGSTGYIGTYSNDQLYIQQNSAPAITIDTSRNSTFAGVLKITDGSAGAPAIAFTNSGSDHTGIYRSDYASGKDNLNFAVDGSTKAYVNEAGIFSNNNVYFTGQLRKFGEWHATSGTSGQGFKFTNTADSVDALTITSDGNATFAGSAHWDLSAGEYSGDPRAVAMGYSGGNYGQLGYNIAFTSTSNTHTRVFNDIPTRMDLYDGIRLYSSTAASAGTSISWTEILRAQSNNFLYKGQTIYHSGNNSTILNSNVTLSSLGAQAAGNYLTSYSETDTLDTVCDRGASTDKTLTSTNQTGFKVDSTGYARIVLDATDSWSYVRFADQGVTTWDIASLNSGNLEWRPAGSSTNRMTYSTGGVLSVPTLSVTDYGLASADIPNNAANTSGSSGSCTGNAATATSASSAAKLTDGGGISTHPGTSNLIYTGALGSTVSGLFTASDNSNSILTVNRHVGDYNSQLGFSSNGNLYYRKFSNSTAYTTQVWKTLAFTDTDITGDTTGNAATATNVAYSGLTGTVPTWNQNTTGSSGSCTGNAASVTNGVYTTGNQTIAGNKTFSGQVTANNSIYLQDGEGIYITGQNYPHLTLSGDEPTLSSGQGDTCYLSDNVRVNGDLTVNGGDITLNGTGKITGIDTVTAATHAANKSYVDTQVATRAASSHTHTFASLTSKPTTISGYGITDALVIGTTPTTAKRGDTTTISVAQANAISANTTHAASSHAPSNATANSSDATLLARANHTGTQAYSTLTGIPTKATYDLDHLFDLVGAAADTSTNMGVYTSGSVPANQTIKQNIEALSTRKENFIVACSDETSDLTTGTAKVTFRIPYIMQITNVRASLTTACTTGVVTVDININGSSIFGNGETGTRLTIDSGERTSTTAATAYNFVSSATAVTFADDVEVSIDIDTVGTETPGKGLKVTLIGYHR